MSAVNSDIYEQKLDEEILHLQKCQSEHNVKSCKDCEYYIGCDVRKAYVNAVYSSMSKGDTGGFEF
ncbi:MAG: hypothetical protein U9R50_06125 [Campylobacterota bacterium]|nr:hypothetical protein [Campylobacterota bacterium]